MIFREEFQPYQARYASLPVSPMKIICHLRNKRIVSFDHIFLDNLLAYAVVAEATKGRMLPPSRGELYHIPLPIEELWKDEQGRILWAATCLKSSSTIDDRSYMHKRAQTGRFTKARGGKFSLNPSAGRYMERRTLLKATVCPTLEAWAIGNTQEVARLLKNVHHIGKHRNIGYGDVDQWEVLPGESIRGDGTILIDTSGLLTRPVPAVACKSLGIAALQSKPVPVAWTLPYWHGKSRSDGFDIGTRVDTATKESDNV